MKVEEIVIVGGGICGLATAVALRRVGIEAVVVERGESLRTTGAALGLFSNAWCALDALGVSHKLKPLYPPLTKSTVTNVSTGATQEVPFTPNGNGTGPIVVHRKTLLQALAEELPMDAIRFSCKITSISIMEDSTDHHSSIAVLHMEDGTFIKTKVVIGCDGVHSRVAHWLGLDEPLDSGRSGVRGISVFPRGHGFNKSQISRFVHSGLVAAFVPLNEKELYWVLVIGKSVPPGELEEITANTPAEVTQKQVIQHYCKDFPPVFLEVTRHLDLSTLSWAPLKLRVPWNIAFGKLSKGTITVAGDAMHPMTPDLGQGGCCALEDAVILARNIGEGYLKNGKQLVSSEVEKAIKNYVEARRWRVAGVIATSFVSGWVQQDGSTWLMRFIRDVLFYKYFYSQWVSGINKYDCGKLPDISTYSAESDYQSKID